MAIFNPGNLDLTPVTNNTNYISTNPISSPTSGSIADLVQAIRSSLGLSASGHTWFISKSGDDGNTGTSDNPFLTIQKGHDVANPGDVVVIDSGTYDENVYPEGLKVTKDMLRFLGKEPYQVNITNTNVGKTSTIYIDATSVQFENVYTTGDVWGTGCVNGWIIAGGGAKNLVKLVYCGALFFSGIGFDINQSFTFIENCITGTGGNTPHYHYYIRGQIGTQIDNCVAVDVGGTISGYGFFMADNGGSAANIFNNCHAERMLVGHEIEGTNVTKSSIRNCTAGNCTTSYVNNGVDCSIVNPQYDSLITAGNFLATDTKAIYDKTVNIEDNTDVLVSSLYLQSGNVWYIDSTMPLSGDGTSPTTAFKTIQEGHDAADNGDVIIIASGTYDENVNVEGLKVTKSQLRFLAKEPYQVGIKNSNGGATSTICITGTSNDFTNIYTIGDVFGSGGCSVGWLIGAGVPVQLNRVIACGAVLHSVAAYQISSGTINYFIDCFAYANLNPATFDAKDFSITGGSDNFLINCNAAGASGKDYGFYVTSNTNHIESCKSTWKNYNYYVEAGANRNYFTDCRGALPTILNKSDNGNSTSWINFQEDSSITAGNSFQQDLKAIYDQTVAVGKFGTAGTGILNDANPDDEITTTSSGATAYIGISLENLQNADDFDIKLQRWDGANWRTYIDMQVTKAAGLISINTGSGATIQNLDQINFEDIYLDSTLKLRLVLVKNSLTDRDFPYFVNKQEKT